MNLDEKEQLLKIIDKNYHDKTLELTLQFTRYSEKSAKTLATTLSKQLEREYEYASHKGYKWFSIEITPDVLIEINVEDQEDREPSDKDG